MSATRMLVTVPVTINRRFITRVLRVMRQATSEPKRNLKFVRPIQSLPRMPLSKRYSLKARMMPNMGRYAKTKNTRIAGSDIMSGAPLLRDQRRQRVCHVSGADFARVGPGSADRAIG